MKIELNENKVYFNSGLIKKEIHPFWLRERVDGEEFLDKGTQQRLFDPTTLSSEISINTASINEQFLEINFNDGVKSKLNIDKLALNRATISTSYNSSKLFRFDVDGMTSLANIKIIVSAIVDEMYPEKTQFQACSLTISTSQMPTA